MAEKMKKPRRKRSELTHSAAVKAVEEWAADIERMANSSEDFDLGQTPSPPGYIVYKMKVKGGFTTHIEFFEALRVLGGHKLPAKETPHDQ